MGLGPSCQGLKSSPGSLVVKEVLGMGVDTCQVRPLEMREPQLEH